LQPSRIGPIIASAVAVTVADASVFRSGRQLPLGLDSYRDKTPPAVKRGWEGSANAATAIFDVTDQRRAIRAAAIQNGQANSWLAALLGRRPRLVVAVALANKTARIAWAIMMVRTATGELRRQFETTPQLSGSLREQ